MRGAPEGAAAYSAAIDKPPALEPTMTNRTLPSTPSSPSLGVRPRVLPLLGAFVTTLALLAGIDGLALQAEAGAPAQLSQTLSSPRA